MTVITRFAPSPTGYLHIGGARTALFNWLYARHMGGKYVVRIEDTDKERSTQEAVDAIHDALNWLGLQGDEPIVFQSDRADRHIEVAHALVQQGAAYYDYTTHAEMVTLGAEWAKKNPKAPFRYLDNPWRELGSSLTFGPPSDTKVIRLKAPREGVTVIDDLVQGTVTVQNKELDDMILLRSDGTPTYMLAVVVDDHDMGVTHVIRGDDHFNNAFRQLPIYKALGWPEPTYAHIPLIFSEDGKKLSKRTGAAAVDEYQAMGIPTDAMLNYLARLGWGHGDDEIFSMKQAIKWFDVKDVGRSPARINVKKLRSISSHYIKDMDSNQLFVYIWQRSQSDHLDIASKVKPEQIIAIVDSLKPRSANLNELYEGASFLWTNRPIQLDDRAQLKINLEIIKDLSDCFISASWDEARLMEIVHGYLDDHSDLKLIDIATSLRAALTGKTVSPPIYDVMLALGKDETLVRLKDRI